MKFNLDKSICIGCGACSVACMDQHDTDLAAGEVAFRKVDNINFTSYGCMHCDDAPCIKACPKGCLKKDDNGFTLYDSTYCIGCRMCSRVCPFDAISFVNEKIAKCDGCHTRVENGLLPACVRICPTKALSLEQ